MGSHGEEAGASMWVMLDDGRSAVSVRCVAFAAAGMGTSTFVLVLLVAMEETARCSVVR